MKPGGTALVTGGSSGLGLALAHELARQGFTPAVLARGSQRVQTAVAALRSHAPDAFGLACDVTDAEGLARAAAEVAARRGGLEFLVLNAGTVHVNRLEDFDCMDALKEDIETDLWGTVLAARFFVPLLRPGGRILCISSTLGLVGAAGYPAYCAAKAGVINFAAGLRRELLHRRITVQVACPSDIDTPQYRQEIASMPEWMGVAQARGRPSPPQTAATRILKRCRGGRFLILIDLETRLLVLARRLLPWRWSEALLDRLLPRPR